MDGQAQERGKPMKQTIIPMKMDAKIVLNVGGDLYLEGIDQSTFIAIVDDGDTFKMREENGKFYIHSNADCKLSIPESVITTIERVNGDCSIRNLQTRSVVGRIDGDLHLRSLGGASIENVGGDCVIKDASGNIEIARVGGDLTVDQSSQLLVSNIGGDLNAENLTGKVESAVGGDVELILSIQQIPEIKIKAGGDIHLIVPEGANAMLDLFAGGEVNLQTVDQKGNFTNAVNNLPLGQGGALVTLKAGGDIIVTDRMVRMPEFGRVFDELETDWNRFSHDIELKVSQSMERAYQASERAVRRAEDVSRLAQEKMDKAMRRFDEKVIPSGHNRKYSGFVVDKPPVPPAAPKPPVSEEERMLILKMLQEKKITVDEADRLLKAMEE